MNVPAVAASPEDFPALLEDGAFLHVLEQCSISFLMPFLDAGYQTEGTGNSGKPSLSAMPAKPGYSLVFSNISPSAAAFRLALVSPMNLCKLRESTSDI